MGHNPARQFAVLTTLYRSDRLDYFELAIRSIETQETDASIRIYLCIDGDLPQEHEAYLSANGTRFHRIVRNSENLGLARSLNSLIDVLEDEELVFRMDGDDISHPRRFAVQAAYMDSHPEIGLIGCQAYDIDEEGEIVGKREFATDPQDVARLMSRMTSILHPTFCIRRSILRDPEARYPAAYLTEDAAFIVLLLGRGVKVANIEDFLFYWRVSRNFFHRRTSFRRGLAELTWYGKATHINYGVFTPQYVYPLARFAIRCMPNAIVRKIYGSGIRQRAIKG